MPERAVGSPPPTNGAKSRLGGVIKGRQKTARRILIYGDGGLGKTTLAAGAPRPIFIDANLGSNGFDVDRYPFDDSGRTKPENTDELIEAVHDIARNGAGKYDALVLDVLSDVEQLIWAELVKRAGVKSINDGSLGYGNGLQAAVDEWRKLASALEVVWRADMHVILLDHTEVKKEKNHSGADYGRQMPKIDTRASKFFHTWCDYTFFVEVEAVLVPDDADARKAKKAYMQSDGKRILHARPAAEYMAKSRPELPDPLVLPRTGGWQMLENEIAAAQQRRVAELRAGIQAVLDGLTGENAAKVKSSLDRAGDDDSKLEQLSNWLSAQFTRKEAAHAA